MLNLPCPLEGSSSEGSHCKTYLPYIFLKTQHFSLMRSFLLFCQHAFKIEHTVTFVCRKSSQFWGLSLWLTSEKFFNKVMIFLWNKDIKTHVISTRRVHTSLLEVQTVQFPNAPYFSMGSLCAIDSHITYFSNWLNLTFLRVATLKTVT